MENYFRLKVTACFWLATNVIVTGEDPYEKTAHGVPKIIRYDLSKLEGTQRTFELPMHVRKWTIEYLSNVRGQDPSHDCECILNLDFYPTATNGELDAHGVFSTELHLYDEQGNFIHTIELTKNKPKKK